MASKANLLIVLALISICMINLGEAGMCSKIIITGISKGLCNVVCENDDSPQALEERARVYSRLSPGVRVILDLIRGISTAACKYYCKEAAVEMGLCVKTLLKG